MRLFKVFRKTQGNETGVTLIETLIALTILSLVAAAFLGSLATMAKADIIADEQTTAESLARNQIEWAKNTDYVYGAAGYSPAPAPSGKDYLNYSATITAEPLHNPDDGIQKIIVTVIHHDKEVIILEDYKVDR